MRAPDELTERLRLARASLTVDLVEPADAVLRAENLRFAREVRTRAV